MNYGDAGIEKSLGSMYQHENQVAGKDVAALRPMFEYINQAVAAAK
jgi:hypothetical protein